MTLEDKLNKDPEQCYHWHSARTQRKAELDRGETNIGTLGYERRGCYDCEGYNKSCPTYISNSRIYKSKKSNS